MGRTAPAPDIPPTPGMCPHTVVKAGGGAGGGSGSGGAGSGGGGSGGGPGGGGDGAGGGGPGAGAGSPDGSKYKPCGAKSCPIDVGTGRMYTLAEQELALPGPLPLVFERQYSSFVCHRDIGLGYGWVHSYAWEVEVRMRGTRVWTHTGTWEDFPPLEVGQEHQGKWGWVLRREADGYVLDTNEGVWRALKHTSDKQRYRLTAEYDRNGNSITLEYAGDALSRIIDSVGREVRVSSNAERRIASISVRNAPTRGQWVAFGRYEYNDQGELISATDADNFANRYVYDDRGRHLLIENGYKTGLVFYFRYDRQARCVESYGAYPGKTDPSLADGLPTTLSDGQTPLKGVHHVLVEYYPDGLRIVHDSTRLETYQINQHGLLDMANVGGAVSTATFRADGWVMSETDALNNTTVYERDQRGNLTKVTDPLGRSTVYERDADGLLTKVIDPAGGEMTLTRDARGNVEVVTDAAGGVTSYRRDARGQVTAISDARGATSQLAYDTEQNLSHVWLPNGSAWQYSYDAFGRMTTRTDPLGAATHYVSSARGDLVSERDALGQVTKYSYDGDGYLTQLVNPVGAVTKLEWGGLHKLCARVDANGHRVSLGYNHEGELLVVENEEGEQHFLDRDANGLLIDERTFDDRQLRYRNDLLGRTVRVENGAGEFTELEYDAGSQLLARTLNDNTNEAFAYNLRGELTQATNAAGSFEFERDAVGHIVREAQTVGGVQHWVAVSHDGEGERLGRSTSLGHTETVQRDALGARTQTLLDGTVALAHTSDALGREVARLLPGGGRIETGFDALGRVQRRLSLDRTAPAVPDASGRGVTVDTAYRYSADGELVEALDLARGKSEYRYDPVGQILAMVPTQARQELFRFDPRGNVYEADSGSARRRYGKGSRLLQKGDTHYQWDLDGRLVEKRVAKADADDEVWRYGWDAAGLLAEVERPDGKRVRFAYDPFARRVEKELLEPLAGGSMQRVAHTRFVWDGDVLAHEIRERAESGGDPVVEERTYLYEDDSFEPVAHREAGRWLHYVNDQIGTPERLLEDGGDVACELRRSAWGETEVQPGAKASTPIRFQGQYADDETGLSYNRWRYYDGEAGAFSSRDPIGLGGGIVGFGYAPSSLRWVDPLGLSRVTREKRWQQLASDPHTTLPKEVVDHIKRHEGRGVSKRFGLELAHKPGRACAQGHDYSEAVPKFAADHRGIQHRYLQERKTGTTVKRPKKKRSGRKLDLPPEGSLPG